MTADRNNRPSVKEAATHLLRSPARLPFMLLCAAAVLLFAGAAVNAEQSVQEEILQNLQRETDSQQQALSLALSDAELLLQQSTSNVRFIDAGLTDEADSDTISGYACAELNRITERFPLIESAYLVCGRNHIIYNSVDSIAYAEDSFYDADWRQQLYTSRGGLQLLDTPRVARGAGGHSDTYISLAARVPYFSTLQTKYLVFNIRCSDLFERTNAQNLPADTGLWVFNAKGEVLYSSTAEAPSLAELTQRGSGLTVSETLEESGWTVVSGCSADVITRQTLQRLLPAMLALVILLIAASFALLRYAAADLQRQRAGLAAVSEHLGTAQNAEESAEECISRAVQTASESLREKQAILDCFSRELEETVVLSLVGGQEIRAQDRPAYDAMLSRLGLTGENTRTCLIMLARIEAITAVKMTLHQDLYKPFPQYSALLLQ